LASYMRWLSRTTAATLRACGIPARVRATRGAARGGVAP
jgi:hypothetical protein